jgi:hypothetical protein
MGRQQNYFMLDEIVRGGVGSEEGATRSGKLVMEVHFTPLADGQLGVFVVWVIDEFH